ncbi:MAG: hypothetical protein Q4E55_07345 [Bacteroidales bacterium]|nr:hypothetical protein [Bacteroidales bacterium]
MLPLTRLRDGYLVRSSFYDGGRYRSRFNTEIISGIIGAHTTGNQLVIHAPNTEGKEVTNQVFQTI